jgi:hypothetical protein
VNKNVAIAGPGVSALTIDGKTLGRVFHLSLASVVTISHLSITNGVASGSDDGGGCVHNVSSDLTLDHVRIFECSAGYGGAVLNDGVEAPARLRIVDSTIDHNATFNAGAGVYNDGSSPKGDASGSRGADRPRQHLQREHRERPRRRDRERRLSKRVGRGDDREQHVHRQRRRCRERGLHGGDQRGQRDHRAR